MMDLEPAQGGRAVKSSCGQLGRVRGTGGSAPGRGLYGALATAAAPKPECKRASESASAVIGVFLMAKKLAFGVDCRIGIIPALTNCASETPRMEAVSSRSLVLVRANSPRRGLWNL
jgi:hypothetical protein